ncbi:MAG: 3',5'-cyclic AMP phosphodiesterase CpdA [Planctomycetota bacterium]|jgi:3',5'-cyclic AMP phosphodiesterase CpdA
MPTLFLSRLRSFLLVTVTCAAAFAGPATAQAPRPRALVWEIADAFTAQTGARRAMIEAGFAVQALDDAASLAPQLAKVDVLFLGSFVSEADTYAAFWSNTSENSASLHKWIGAGGTLVQMTQADQTEASPMFLPSSGDMRMSASRNDVDLATVLALAPGHPLIDAIATESAAAGAAPGTPARFPSWSSHHRVGAWEAFDRFEGMRVLAGDSTSHRRPAVLEGALGKGRVLLAALHFDKLDGTTEDGATFKAAPKDFVEISRQWFRGLHTYVGLVRAGNAPEVIPSTPWIALPPAPFVEGSFTIAVLPDTQIYAERYPQHFTAQTRWITENQDALDIRYVLHLGDITNRNTPEQWVHAKAAIDVLHEGGVPYALAPGNHDYGPNGNASTRDTLLNDTFPLSSFDDWPTFGGTHEEGKLDSSYHVFTAGTGDSLRRFLVLVLEWGPRSSCVAWANDVVARHPGHEVILVTHAYMFSDETRYDWSTRGTSQTWNPHSYGMASLEGGAYDGEELWQGLVSKHPGFIMTLNGHVLNDGQAWLKSTGEQGNSVHQMLCNYQTWHEGGDGYLRLYEFRPDGTVQAKSYSPVLDRWLTEPDQQFLLTYPGRAASGQK